MSLLFLRNLYDRLSAVLPPPTSPPPEPRTDLNGIVFLQMTKENSMIQKDQKYNLHYDDVQLRRGV